MVGKMHVATRLADLAETYSDRIALVDAHGQWTFRDFVARCAAIGHALHCLGLHRGDRVALLLPDIREYLEADYGIMAAGLVRVPMDPRLPPADLAALLRHSGARTLITHRRFAGKVAAVRSAVATLETIVSIGGATAPALDYEILIAAAPALLPEAGDGDELATLNFSGGTTGAPKAIMLRHRNLMAVTQNNIAGFDIRDGAVFLNLRPLWPIAQIILMSYLFAGGTVVLGERFEPRDFSALVARTGATRTSLVPTQLVRILDRLRPDDPRLARLEAIHVGGSGIPTAVFERALALLGPKIGVLYGLTEAPVTCYLPPDRLAHTEKRRNLIHSVGPALSGYAVRLDPSTPDAPEGGGEVLIRGAHVMAGYWQDEAATQASLREGWLRTGDIGRFDKAGHLFITGRLKEVIRSGASSINPKEVEDAVASHPAIGEVAVVGLPDVEWGEAVTAFVVLKPGASASESEIIEHCRALLASYKKPRAVRFTTSLPRSHYGKVLKAELVAGARREAT